MQKLIRRPSTQGPTLGTIRMVEDTIKNHDDSTITVAELKRALPRQVNHNALVEILDYLDKSNKIYIGVKGITWIKNDSPILRRMIEKGTRH